MSNSEEAKTINQEYIYHIIASTINAARNRFDLTVCGRAVFGFDRWSIEFVVPMRGGNWRSYSLALHADFNPDNEQKMLNEIMGVVEQIAVEKKEGIRPRIKKRMIFNLVLGQGALLLGCF